MNLPSSLVDAAWLAAVLGTDAAPFVADVRWDPSRPEGRAYVEGHIPGAVRVDVDHDLSAPVAPDGFGGRHPLPSPEDFAATMSRLGIADTTAVVAYDDTGGSTAARLWWMLRVLGHPVALLDGGLEAWAGRLEPGAGPTRTGAAFTPKPWPADALIDARALADTLDAGDATLVDVRAPQRFRGEAEPLDKLAGHVPGARNLPWSELLVPETHRVREGEDLRTELRRHGVTQATPVVAQCGSGVTACLLLFALERSGIPGGRLYAGSWSDWIADPSRPTATGDA